MAGTNKPIPLAGSQGSYMGTEGYKRAYIDILNNSKYRDPDAIGFYLSKAGDSFDEEFTRTVGRRPTADEANKFYTDVLRGTDAGYAATPSDLAPILKSYVSDTYSDVAAKEKQANLGKEAQQHYGTVNQLFQSSLGRDASQAELDHFAKLKASGEADDYSLGEALKNIPEYQERQDNTARESLRGELQTADKRFLTEEAAPAIQSRFAQQGRYVGPESTALASAFANAGQALNVDRERFLATAGREDYTNRRQQAIQGYLDTLRRGYAKEDYGVARSDALADVARNRGYEIQDYDKQKRAYDEYIKNMGRRKSGGGVGSLIGGVAGGVLGAYAGGPSGASAGYSIGSSGGSIFDKY